MPLDSISGGCQFWVYILQNAHGKFYIGHTDDIPRRLAQHNDAEAARTKFTIKNGPWRLVWSESHATRAAAMHREQQIKRMKSSRWIREQLLGEPVK